MFLTFHNTTACVAIVDVAVAAVPAAATTAALSVDQVFVL